MAVLSDFALERKKNKDTKRQQGKDNYSDRDGNRSGFYRNDPQNVTDTGISDRSHSTCKTKIERMSLIDAFHSKGINKRSHQLQQGNTGTIKKSGKYERMG